MKDANFPTLLQLLKNKTVFVLGAGSTVDYGFPLWAELRLKYIEMLDSKDDTFYSEHPGASYWRDKLSDPSVEENVTVDQLAANASDDGLNLFQLLTYNTFSKLEYCDKNNDQVGWIEILAEKYIGIIQNHGLNRDEVRRCLGNIVFCSLNYERCFPYHFGRFVTNKLSGMFPNTIKRDYILGGSNRSYSNFYQPHGSLGGLHASEGTGIALDYHHHYNLSTTQDVPYGADKKISNRNDPRLKFILPVDLLYYGDQNPSYRAINRHLSSAVNIVIIGLSRLGLDQSMLEFPESKNIFYTGSGVDEWNCLDCHAQEFAEAL